MSGGVDAIDSHFAAESSDLASVAAKRAAIGRYVDAVRGLRASYAAFSASIASGNPASSQALVYQFATQLTTDASSLVGAFRATKTGIAPSATFRLTITEPRTAPSLDILDLRATYYYTSTL